MSNLRAIRNRIRSVTSTGKTTKAMKMVSAARFRKAQERVMAARPYAQKVNELLSVLLEDAESLRHPLLDRRETENRALLVLTSDRGLCGAFNANVLRLARQEMIANPPLQAICLGKKGSAYFARHFSGQFQSFDEYWDGFGYERSQNLIRNLAERFLKREIDQVDVVYNEFHSVISQKPTKVTILPFAANVCTTENLAPEIIFEPTKEAIIEALVPRAMEVRFYLTCLNSLAGEFGARMTAMDSASRNAQEMISALTLKMNRARQAGITTELMEIIGGAEALSEM